MFPKPFQRALSLFHIFMLCISFSFVPFPAQAAAAVTDDEMLDQIQRKAFDYFYNERHPATGLVRDLADNGKGSGMQAAASIAATGFALTVYPVAVSRNWLDYGAARTMTAAVLRFLLEKAETEHGFFYHFMNMETGAKTRNSELSPIDTALFLAGALFAAEYYEDPEIRGLVSKIYDRVDWPWMLHGGKTFAMAWTPDGGFYKNRWDSYNESMIMYLEAVGSKTHPIPAESWKAIARPVGSYGNHRVIAMPPLFTHQYSHIWVDFKDKNDGFADYFKNSVEATLANRQFCIDESANFKTYGPGSWGLTASDGPGGYQAYGAPPGPAKHDGTVAPTACGSSIVFTPKESLACLRNFYENKKELWGRYGFSDAFNEDRNWVSPYVLAIDQGPLMLMIENYRTGMIWKTMQKSAPIQAAMKAVGFREGTKDLPWPDPPVHEAVHLQGLDINAMLSDWPSGKPIVLDESHREMGDFREGRVPETEVRFGWSPSALLFYAKVSDKDIVARKTGKNIWMDDLIELYIDPKGDGLDWGSEKDFQIGFRPEPETGNVLTWSWFGDRGDPQAESVVIAKSFTDASGYLIEGAVSWEYLGIHPKPGMEVRLSVAVHDVNRDRSGGKLHWFFRNEEKNKHYVLGKVVLKE